MADKVSNILGRLLPVKWRDVGFPTTGFRHALEHDQVQHRYMDRDGAHVEATGRSPFVFSCRALFRNGIEPGATERDWPRPLYPDGWRKFLVAAADRSTGKLIHPELGEIQCKLRSAETVWDAGVRDGVDVDVTWVESTDDSDDALGEALGRPGPLAGVQVAAVALSEFQYAGKTAAEAARLTGAKDPPGMGLLDFANKLTALVDKGTLLERRGAGVLDQALYRAGRVVDAMDRVASPPDWPGKRQAQVLMDSLVQLRDTASRPFNKPTRYFVTTRDMTLTAVAAYLQRPINVLVTMNPKLATGPVIPAGTIVKYAAA